MEWLALDVGGANLKVADGRGYAHSKSFALWRSPDRLADELRALIDQAPGADALAVTMTGELADCYESKADGVRSIVAAVTAAAGSKTIAVYQVDGTWASPDEVAAAPRLAAASNWRALAEYVHRGSFERPALLIDLGSTTADVIPLDEHGPCPAGLTDAQRLLAGELVYTGVDRTPLGAVVQRLPLGGVMCPVAAEHFATTADAYLLLGEMPPDAANTDTADGRPRTIAAARGRLARMLCADLTELSPTDIELAAAAIRDAQLQSLAAAAEHVAARLGQPPRTLVLSGQGEHLLRRLAAQLPWRSSTRSLSQEWGADASRCAPAHALAALAREAHPLGGGR